MASRARWDPFREIAALQSELGRLMSSAGEPARGESWIPPTDVWETEGEIVYAFDLPGVPQDEISIELEQDTLTVSGERPAPDVARDRFHRAERRYGPFTRSVSVPPGATEEQIAAEYTDGVLALRIAKPEAPRPRRIQIGGQSE
jgi:HSP20 family protein